MVKGIFHDVPVGLWETGKLAVQLHDPRVQAQIAALSARFASDPKFRQQVIEALKQKFGVVIADLSTQEGFMTALGRVGGQIIGTAGLGELLSGLQSLTAAESSTIQANKAAGKAAELLAKADLEAQGITVLGSNVTARTTQGLRYIDHLVDVDGELFAVEVKSGGASRSSSQILKDTAMEIEGATLSGPNVPASLQGQTFKIPTVEMHY